MNSRQIPDDKVRTPDPHVETITRPPRKVPPEVEPISSGVGPIRDTTREHPAWRIVIIVLILIAGAWAVGHFFLHAW